MYIVPQKDLKLYSYNELSDDAKERAFEEWRDSRYEDGFLDWYEYEQAMKDFAYTFGLKIKDYSIGTCSYSYIDFEVESEDIENLKGIRLYKYLYNKLTKEYCVPKSEYWKNKNGTHITFININSQKVYEKNGKQRFSKIFFEDRNVYTDSPLTGCWTDYFYHQSIEKFMKHPDLDKTYKELMDDAFGYFIKNCIDDEEYSFSEEYFKECDAQESYYYETGICYGSRYDESIEKYEVSRHNDNVEFCIEND